MGLTLVVLAAGMGSRYGGLKQVDGFGPHEEPILLYSVYDAIAAGFDHVVFVIRKEFYDAFALAVGSKVVSSVRVSYVYQEKDSFFPQKRNHYLADRQKPWGTAHATLVTKDLVDCPFAVINADDFYGRDAYFQIAQKLTSITSDQMLMVGYVLENTISPYGSINRGICTVQQGNLVHVNEHLKIQSDEYGCLRDDYGVNIPGSSIVSMNFRGFHQTFFDELERCFEEYLQQYRGTGEYFIPRVVDALLSQGTFSCEVLMSKDHWCGVSYQEDKPFVQQTLAKLHEQGVYPAQLFR